MSRTFIERQVSYFYALERRDACIDRCRNRPDCRAIALKPYASADGTMVYPVEITYYSLD